MASDCEYQVVPFTPEEQDEINKFYLIPFDSARIIPGNWVTSTRLSVEKVKNFQVFEDDIWIVTPPKCGTTWMQELTWLICNNVDLEKAKLNQFYRMPFLELGSMIPKDVLLRDENEIVKAVGPIDVNRFPGPEVPKNEDTVRLFMFHSMEFARNLPRPRIIKSHLPVSLLPKNTIDKCKIIYVGRNVKDATVSSYHHMKLSGFQGSFEQFALLCKRGVILFNPLIPHVLEGWNLRNQENFFFTTYEEMSADLRGVAIKLIKFLGRDENTIDMEKLLNAVHIESFRKNKFVNKEKEIPPDEEGNSFIRKGQVGDWKNYFTEEMNREWDPWIEDQTKGTEFKMIFEQ